MNKKDDPKEVEQMKTLNALDHGKKHETKNILDLYGIFSNGEQTEEDFETIRERAKKKYYQWKKSEGKY